MKRLPKPQNSLTAKMVLAFIFVAVPPMLISGYMIVWLVNQSINHNMEKWLQAGHDYIFSVIGDMQKQIVTIQKLEQTNFSQHSLSIDPTERDTMQALGIDFVVLTDTAGRVVYSAPEAIIINETPIFPGSVFYFAHSAGGEEQILAIVERSLVTDAAGAVYELTMGAEFEIDIVVDDADVMELRIFIPDADGFKEVYSSRPEEQFELTPGTISNINLGTKQFFISGDDWTDSDLESYSILTVYRDAYGNVEGLIIISALMRPFDEWYMTPSIIFWIFIVVGTTLSSLVGYVFARKLVNPIKQLSAGARHVARGNFEYKVRARGNDEVAHLAKNFNIMSNQLEMARKKIIETNRQERARMLGEIAIGFAHEIRNPLVIIKTSAELVCGTLSTDKKERRILGFVIEEVGRIDSLLTEFLTFARPAPLQFEYMELRPLVESILEISAGELAKRNIKWSLTDQTPLETQNGENKAGHAKVIGEYSKIRQVLLNLVLNAMDAMPGGGSLGVCIYPSADAKMLRVDIKDSGNGIPEDLRDAIHLPFKSTKPNGQGLGLAVAYAIIEGHDGEIFFETHIGQGTTFTIGLRR